MKRISPVLVLLLAAGCANAGISDWLNPFRMFGGKPPPGAATAPLLEGFSTVPADQGIGGPVNFISSLIHPILDLQRVILMMGSSLVSHLALPILQAIPQILTPSQRLLARDHIPLQRSRAPPPQHAAASSPINGPPQDSPDGSPLGYGDFSQLANGPSGNDYEGNGPPSPQGPISGAPQRHRGPPPGYRGRPGGRGRSAGQPDPHNLTILNKEDQVQITKDMEGPHQAHLTPITSNRGPSGQPSGPPPGFGGGPGQGSDAPFFASSPGANAGPFGNRPDQDRSPFQGGPQQSSPFGQGPSEGIFGPSEGAPQQQGPGGPGPGNGNGPQSFFGANGNDYPEQFEGGSRETREPHPQQNPQGPDFRPQPNGPPQGLPGFGDLSSLNDSPGEQSPGFYGALHNTEGGQQQGSGAPNFFNQQQQQPGAAPSSIGGPGGPPQGSPYLNSHQGPSPYGHHGGPAQNNGPQYAPRPRKPPIRLGLRNPLAAAFQSSASNVPAYSHSHNNHGGGPLMMSASGAKPSIIPGPKLARSLLRPFIRKPGGILPLSSPRDPNYRRMSLSPSNMSPVTAQFEPDTAASGGLNGGYGDVGLSPNGDRILYHVSGHSGPHSYRFGFDTGKGYNRIFRFEEKDGKGYVTGKYGFYDKSGKLNIINYQAHPKHGYHAERGHSHGHY
ncbi:hypothetical protein Ocin01_06375 [Orchesella cincta]|uniref:Pro-resilin n=1 Tax=Orchesella cincta TaxID=48709 RepID=A0A1D2N5S6_ORCCI|nr:hypothetical protein Ocin01_06375 [Orchesella cincta]